MNSERRNEKLDEKAIKTDNKILLGIENYWYHYKWPTVIVLFFAIVILVCTLQMCGRESTDITIVYAGSYAMEAEEAADIKSVLNYIMPDDYDDDGKKNSQLLRYYIPSKEEIEKLDSKDSAVIDRTYISNENENFFNYANTEASVCFLSPHLYETLRDGERLANVSELLGYTPEGLVDEYGVKLSQTDLYADYAVLRKLPEDTVVCILRRQLTKKEAVYENEKAFFAAIVNYNSDAENG